MVFFLKLKHNYLSKMHGYPIFLFTYQWYFKDLLSKDTFKPSKNITVFESITDRN